MSKYTLLLVLNTPFIIAGLLNALVSYKMSKISRRRFMFHALLWLSVLAGLIGAHALYQFLFSNHLTDTEPLSLFDVIQITGIILLFFIVNRSRVKLEHLERRVQDLHQELSIRLAEPSINSSKKK